MLNYRLISSHVLLKHESETCFHVFANGRPGCPSLCGDGVPISSVRTMDIPGERSPCCNKCSYLLYGYPREPVPVKEKKL